MFVPHASVGTETVKVGLQPEVVDIGRRIRLMPRERLSVEVWPDPGSGGWLMEANGLLTVRQGWRVMQGFSALPNGSFEVGPMCLEAHTRTVVRTPLSRGAWAIS